MSGRPLAGFWGLLRGELSRWVGRRGLIHLAVWTALIQGQLYAAITYEWDAYDNFWGFDLVVHLLWIFPAIGAIAVGQGAVGEERVWGTAGWVLARPVTRGAFIWSKLLGTALPLILVAVVAQGLIAYAWLPDLEPDRGLRAVAPDAGRYTVVLALLSLLVLFFVALTVFLGTLLRRRAAVAALSLVVFLIVWIPGERASWHEWYPGGLVEGNPTNGDYKRLSEYLLGGPLDAATAVWATAAAVVVMTLLATWRFRSEEL